MPKKGSVKLAHYRALNRLQVTGVLPPPPLRLTAGQWIKTVRVRLRLTQRHLASLSGVSQGQIALIEKGYFEPQLATVRRLFEAMLCDLLVLPAPRGRISALREALWRPIMDRYVARIADKRRRVID